MQLETIIRSFNLDPASFEIEKISTGYINATYKLTGASSFILQRVNKNVFIAPDDIASNLRTASNFLKENYPDYLFLTNVKSKDGKEMVYDEEGFPWRLFPFISNSITIEKVETEAQAYSAASEFARLTNYLENIDVNLFKPTILRFHDLSWRYEQFETALLHASLVRKQQANDAIDGCLHFKYLVHQYTNLIQSGDMRLRITHNDNKISNILFDATTQEAICVIDLDTLMPGYFIYDVGDMIRTFVSPVSEEERDLNKIVFRKNIYNAVIDGYQSQMKDMLNNTELRLFHFGGMMMTYIMALRMLTDFLNGNIYYQISYADQNLVRARNQVRLLQVLNDNQPA
jgi:Ser/Thr protein kinase RdoA (MazF antagonist)